MLEDRQNPRKLQINKDKETAYNSRTSFVVHYCISDSLFKVCRVELSD